MKLPLYTINAFATKPFTGNPAAVCPLDDWLEVDLMQAIAAQNNLAETAFVVKTAPAHYKIRWFTPSVEVPLCGHATLASAFALKTEQGERADLITFESQSGPLSVQCQKDGYTLDLPSQAASRAATPEWLIGALGANPVEFHQAEFALAVFPNEAIVSALEPDFSQFPSDSSSNLIVTAPGDQTDFVSRFFAPAYGIDEDPVTGAAHCILTPYWSKRLKRSSRLSARQLSKRGGELTCALEGNRVLITGSAQLYSTATLHI